MNDQLLRPSFPSDIKPVGSYFKRPKTIGIAAALLLLAVVLWMPWFGSGRSGTSSNIKVSGRAIAHPRPDNDFIVPDRDYLIAHIRRTLNYIYRNLNPDTYLAYSLPGDKRLKYWSVTYDNAMRIICHVKTGDIETARKSMDYYIDSVAIQKIGWIYKNGNMVARPGWTVNIVDAAEPRIGGRGIEHISHTGPNVYLGLAALHVYLATKEPLYLEFARNRWELLREIQNENPNDPNYGGIRMGPMGDPSNPQEQKLNFREDSPSFYQFYNGEHAADYRAFSEFMAKVDLSRKKRYLEAARLISIWDQKIYNRKEHLFYIGTTEQRYYDDNIGEWVGPGVVKIFPLDTTALKICSYGVQGLEQFEKDGALKMREAIEKNFKNTVMSQIASKQQRVTGYDFITHATRRKLILFEEGGPKGDIKVNKGVGRLPLLSDEWSSWVAFSDLRMAKDFEKMGNKEMAAVYRRAFEWNALSEGLRTADPLDKDTLAYPYVHPITYGFNKPVGFGWNTHHDPYSMIGGVARILGILEADPFSLDKQSFTIPPLGRHPKIAPIVRSSTRDSLVTEAELYVNEAWAHVRAAQKRDYDEQEQWQEAIAVVDRMQVEHPDWSDIAETQNKLAKNSGEKFPLMGLAAVPLHELEPVFRKYWALYHVGTGEFIKVMAYSEIAEIAKARNDKKLQWDSERLAKESAHQILNRYYYSQAYDKSGWLWQPVLSLREFFDANDKEFDVEI